MSEKDQSEVPGPSPYSKWRHQLCRWRKGVTHVGISTDVCRNCRAATPQQAILANILSGDLFSHTERGSPAILVIALPETMPRSQGRVSYPQDRTRLPALTDNFIPPLWIPRGKSERESDDGKGCWRTKPGIHQDGKKKWGQEACGHM